MTSAETTITMTVTTESLTAKVAERLAQKIGTADTAALAPEVQDELGKLIGLLARARQPLDANLLAVADITATSLLSATPNLTLARSARKAIERQLGFRVNFFNAVFNPRSSVGMVVVGLLMLLALSAPLFIFAAVSWGGRTQVFGIEESMLRMVAFCGLIGSIVSIMVRIGQFSAMEERDPSVLYLTGLFKPVVGSAFAVFVYLLLNAGVANIGVEPGKERFFSGALAFVSGFSERLAQDLTTRVEQVVGAGQPAAPLAGAVRDLTQAASGTPERPA
jgi:hypothetical protein